MIEGSAAMSENSVIPSTDKLDIFRRNVCLAEPQAVLGKEYGVCQQTICRWVNEVREYLRYAKREEITTLRAELTERYEALYAEALRAWARSQVTETVTTVRTEEGGYFDKKTEEYVETEQTVKTVKETPQVGTPQFLKLGMDAVIGIKDLWWSEMSAVDRRGESRSVGKSQAERIDAKIEELQRAKAKLAARQNGGGAGDKA